jgi:hypothetical protein
VRAWVLAGVVTLCGSAAVGGGLGVVMQGVCWSVAVLGGFVGWGWLAQRVLGIRGGVDAGLLMGWGTAVMVHAGGVLAWNQRFSGVAVDLMVALGVAGLWLRARLGTRLRPLGLHRQPVAVVLSAVAVVATVGLAVNSLVRTFQSPLDDHNGYLPLPFQLLQRGDMVQPFSIRRAFSYGGQSVLQAVALHRTDAMQAHLVDMGWALCAVTALMLGAWRDVPRRRRWLLPVGALVVLCLPATRPNVASLFTGLAALLALVRTLAWLDRRGRVDGRTSLLLGVVAAHALVLRLAYVVPCALLLGCSAVLHAWRTPGSQRRAVLRGTAFTVVGTLVTLVPWALAMVDTADTPLFPFIRGTLTSRTHMFEWPLRGGALWEWVKTATLFEKTSLPLWARGAVVLGLLVVPDRTRRGVFVSSVAASVLAVFFVTLTIQQADAGHVERYNIPQWTTAALALLLGAASVRRRMPGWMKLGQLGLLALAVSALVPLARTNVSHLKSVPAFVADRAQRQPHRPLAFYADLQSRVPAGEPILAMVEHPWQLDMKRNPVAYLDCIGFVSPPPHIPFGQGPVALKEYFRGLGLRHLMMADPESARWGLGSYGAQGYRNMLRETGATFHADVEGQLAAVMDMRALVARSRVLAASDDVWLLDLGEPAMDP